MDNDLMARRLRPPSEPTRPQNGHSPWDTDQSAQSPWPPDNNLRSDVPWDKPADEPWPPNDPLWSTDEEPVTEHTWPPTPAAVAAAAPTAESDSSTTPQPDVFVASSEPSEPVPPPPPQSSALPRPSTWDDMPAPWDEPSETSFAATAPAWDVPAAPDTPDVPDTPPAPEPAEASMTEAPALDAPTDVSVPGLAAWDEPEPFDFTDTAEEMAQVDDRPAAMFVAFEDEPVEAVAEEAGEAVSEPVATVAESAIVENDAPPWIAASTDPDDALAPVLSDVEQPAPPPWASWTDDVAADTPQAAIPPADAATDAGPTPPDDLFAPAAVVAAADIETDDESDQEPQDEPAMPPAPSAVADVEIPQSSFANAPPGQPVVVRIEVAIVDGNAVVRTMEDGRHVTPLARAAALDAMADSDASFTPRHPEFEPRNHLNGHGASVEGAVPEATDAPAPWLLPIDPAPAAADTTPQATVAAQPGSVWTLPPFEDNVADPWAQPQTASPAEQPPAVADPMSAWTLEPVESEPLTTLPAASLADAQAAAPVAAAAAIASSAPAQTAQPDLWFLSSEPETMAGAEHAHPSREPSSTMTAGLTVLMAVVVIGLVIAFLWLMTSLPILR